MKNSSLFKKVIIPSLIILIGLTIFLLHQYNSKVQTLKKQTAHNEMTAWMESERILVKTREETSLPPVTLPVTPEDDSNQDDYYPEEPNDEGIEYDYLSEQGVNVSYL